MKKLTTEQFIEKAKKIHGDKYNYSEVDYIKSSEKIKIICPKHGIFEQTPNNHLRGQKCGKCVNLHKNTNDLVNQFNVIHNFLYNYDYVKYEKWNVKVEIICSIHGSFFQTPNAHLNGRGCPKCGINKSKDAKFHMKNDVINKFIEIHKDKYDYSKVNYIKSTTKVEIKCNICNHIFWQTPNNHISKKHGCPKCAGNLKINMEQFLNRSKKLHNNFYEYYIKGNIKNNSSKLKIKCPNHGFFEQSIAKHLQGQGCPKCVHKVSKDEQELYDFIKLFREDAQQSNRKIINPYELDIYIPSLKLAFEYNGEYWHSEKFRDKNHREQKTELCNLKNITLIHIEEKDWKKDKEQIKNKVKTLIYK